MKVSVCIEMIYTELPFLDRIKMAAEQGFDGVEFWNWDNKDLPGIKRVVEEAGLEIAALQSNRGGTLINPEHREMFIAGIKESFEVAKEVKAKSMFLLTDELGEDRSVRHQFPGLTDQEKYDSVLDGLKALAPLAEEAGVTLVLEPLNNLVDHAGYWLKHSDVGFELIRKVGSPNLKLLFDVYHQQVTEGNIIERIIKNLDAIGHIHVADVPGRHQPGTGELNFKNIFGEIRQSGYDRYIGFEFAPTGDSQQAAGDALKLIKG